jgi:hypothetical protein
MPRHVRVVIFGAAAASLVASRAGADDVNPPVEIRRVTIGFDGRFKVGCWTPIEVELSGPPGGSVSPAVIVPDADGSPTTTPLATVTFSGSGPHISRGVFRSGRLTGGVRVVAGDALVRRDPAVAPSEPDAPPLVPLRQSVHFWGLIGEQPGFDRAADLINDEAGAVTVQAVHFDGFDAIPLESDALESLDVMVVAGRFDADPLRSSALERWVQAGGDLVVSVGGNADRWRASPLAAWVPVEVGESMRIRDLSALSGAGVSTASLRGAAEGVRLRIAAGEVTIAGNEGPLLVRAAHGLGRVTVLGVDLHQPPLSDWEGLPQFCQVRLADQAGTATAGAANQRGVDLAPTGVSDLATQLAAILDEFPGVHKPSNLTVLGFVLAFLLLVGPLDYVLMHHLVRRPHWTWVTFPAWIALAAAAGTLCARSFHAGGDRRNQLDLVDLDATVDLCRARSWTTVYSARSQRTAVSAAPADWLKVAGRDAAVSPDVRVSWSGVPEASFRGMYRLGGLDLGNAPYSFSPDRLSIDDLPVDTWSSKGLQADWTLHASPLAASIESGLVADGPRLRGGLVHQLPGAIDDWCLAYGRYVYPQLNPEIAPIPPGVEWEPGRVVQPRTLTAFLTGVVYRDTPGKGPQKGDVARNRTDYDVLGNNPVVLLRILSFHEAAGGSSYTTLQNQTLARWDFSRLLPLNRAVLFGRIKSPATQFSLNGQPAAADEHETFVRIVLPVAPAGSEGGS